LANWDFVFPYNQRAADWLAEQNLPHPAVRPGNRLPSTAEIVVAWRQFDTGHLLLIDGFDWDDQAFVPDDAFKLRGDRLVAFRMLAKLAEQCGQFWMYPDSGEPAIIVDSAPDAERTCSLHLAAGSTENSWQFFYRGMYLRAQT
jgi:hypothetical protein